jgi:hypothetical protein
MFQEAISKALSQTVSSFCQFSPSEELTRIITEVIDSHRIILTYDPKSEIYAHFAFWPLIFSGYDVSVVGSHVAQYYYAPYSAVDAHYIYFTDNPESQTAVQLVSTLRVMGYNKLVLTTSETNSEDVIRLSIGQGDDLVLKAIKNVAVAFSKALYLKTSNQRLKRVIENLAVSESDLLGYLNKAISYTPPIDTNVLAAEGPLLSATKVAGILNPKIKSTQISALFGEKTSIPIEIWGLTTDSELIARLRFETNSFELYRVVHFGFDPLSSALASVYAAAYARASSVQ